MRDTVFTVSLSLNPIFLMTQASDNSRHKRISCTANNTHTTTTCNNAKKNYEIMIV